MANEHRVVTELEEGGKDGLDPGRLTNHCLGDAGQYRDEGWDSSAGIDECLKGSNYLAPQVLHGADLGYLTGVGGRSSGFEIEHAESHRVQRHSQVVQRDLTDNSHPHNVMSNVCSMSRSGLIAQKAP